MVLSNILIPIQNTFHKLLRRSQMGNKRKPNGYWNNFDICKIECQKYKNLKELKSNSSGCYNSIARNGWINIFYPNKGKVITKWEHKENCINKAKRYPNFATFIRLSPVCYLSMKENGWLEEVFADYPDYKEFKYWNNYINCKEECEKYSTITELRKNNTKCYNSIIRNEWKGDFFEINSHNGKEFGYWNNKVHCIEEANKYKTMTELKDKSNGCYASVLKHHWETDCFPDFKKRKPNGYWDIKENCFNEAKKYRNLKEFQLKCYGAYHCAIKNGWKDEINKLYDKTILYHSYNEKIHLVYLYLFVDYNTFYVGRTNNLKRRNQQHIRDHNDSIFKFCNDKGIEIPPYVILKEDLTATESQYYEDFYLKEYINKGWRPLNKAVTGVNKGSLGAVCKWNYEACKMEASKYRNITEFKVKNQSAYNASRKNGWLMDFFEYSKRSDHYWDNYENCKKAFNSCKNTKELIKRFGGCYNSIKKNGFTDLKYPK